MTLLPKAVAVALANASFTTEGQKINVHYGPIAWTRLLLGGGLRFRTLCVRESESSPGGTAIVPFNLDIGL